MNNYRANNGRKTDLLAQYNQHMMSPSARPVQDSFSLDNKPVGMAYVPWQYWQEVYCPEKALSNGTLFPELNKPFTRGAN